MCPLLKLVVSIFKYYAFYWHDTYPNLLYARESALHLSSFHFGQSYDLANSGGAKSRAESKF